MLAAGLDIGSLWTKAVVLRDGAVAGWHAVPTGESSAGAAELSLREALKSVKALPGDVESMVATGAGRGEAAFAKQQATEIVCASRGAAFLHPGIRGIIDMGGESSRAVQLDEKGNVLDYALNDKCAAGTGIFLDAIAKVMKIEPGDMGPLSLESTADVNITSMCVAFAESEVVSLIHKQTPPKDILRGIHKSIATRLLGLVNRIRLQGMKMAVGGLAMNTGIIHCFEELLKEPLEVPDNPRIVNALGAAVTAAGKGGEDRC